MTVTINEWHTTDLITPCMEKVRLTHEGHAVTEMTTALYRGLLAHAALEAAHTEGSFTTDPDYLDMLIAGADRIVRKQSQEEGRPITEAVEKNIEAIHADVSEVVGEYLARFGPYFAECEIIGTELPVRCTIDMDGEPVEFASHVDLMFREPEGEIVVWDWKYQDQAPTMGYLGRNLQFALYYWCIAYGHVRIDAGLDLWESYGEMPTLAWVHLPYLKPYKRKTTIETQNGPVTFQRGDTRPDNAVVKRIPMNPDNDETMKRRLLERVRMSRAGIWPITPDKLGCHLCECRLHCTAHHQ